MKQNDDPDPLEQTILSNLQKGLLAVGEGKEAFGKAFDEMFPEESPAPTGKPEK